MGASPTKAKVLHYLHTHPGVMVWRAEIATDTGLTEKQVQSSIYSMQRSGLYNIRTEAPGACWTYFGQISTDEAASKLAEKAGLKPVPSPEPVSAYPPELSKLEANSSYGNPEPVKPTKVAKPRFSVIGYSEDGSILLRDGNQKIWRATPL